MPSIEVALDDQRLPILNVRAAVLIDNVAGESL
jgi:hypothetical protein